MTKPFLPADLASRSPLALWRRYATVCALAACKGQFASDIAADLYGKDEAPIIMRAAVQPMTTTTVAGVTPTATAAFLEDLRPTSAAAQLIAAGARLNLQGYGSINMPRLGDSFPEPAFVAEGGPIPVKGGTYANVVLGPMSKLAMIAGYTGEMEIYSAQDAETLITGVMNDAASRALDKAIFSTTAASGVRPAGILAGVTPIPAHAEGGIGALLADVKALIGAIVAAGAGGQILIFANPVQLVVLNILAPNGVGYPVLPAPSLPLGTLVAIDPRAFASSFGELPEVLASSEGVIQFEDAAPAQIATAGSPNTVAAPVMSLYQHDLIALRMILRGTWALRSAAVAVVNGVTW